MHSMSSPGRNFVYSGSALVPNPLRTDPPECVCVAEIIMFSVGIPVAFEAAALTFSCMG